VVTATGDRTELGRIGALVRAAGERATPLEREVEILGRRLILLALGVCGVVGVVGILHGEPVGLMVETAISLAVAAIPEGLPAIVAVALATGMWRLARAGALVRRLPAVETLGATTVICVDKTGTMTQNRMAVTRLALAGRTIAVKVDDPGATAFVENGATVDSRADAHVIRLLTVGALVNDAGAEETGEGLRVHGDPTEVALLLAARAAGLEQGALKRRWPRLREVPFSPETRLMATFNATPEGGWAWLVKGAPATVLARSVARQVGVAVEPLAESDREQLLDENRRLAGEGLRVLALAHRSASDGADDRLDDLIFLGFVGIEDPVRPGVAEAITRCRQAGVDTVMLTGDQRVTAEAVGRRLGIEPHAIMSRASPEDKLTMIRELQGRGEVVAMTGDGVNDAPALVRADIGVAMGRRGTDVAREAADLVLTDDDFPTIVRAIEEGRIIYANLRKVIHFLFSCNLMEIIVIFAAIVAGLPAPLLPLQILWVNLVTDILPALALIRDPAERDVMRRPPRERSEALVTWRFGGRVLGEAAVLAAGVLGAFLCTVAWHGGGPRANTVAFLAVVLVHPLHAMHCRSAHATVWRLPSNRLLAVSLVALTLAQGAAVSWRPLTALLGTAPLSGADWLVSAVGVLLPVLALEALKTRQRVGARRDDGQGGHTSSMREALSPRERPE
jgi:Ca2+-transporting ATPase